MWRETSIRQMLELRRSLDLIITSVGTPYGATPSPLFSSGVLSRHDREELNRERVVGGGMRPPPSTAATAAHLVRQYAGLLHTQIQACIVAWSESWWILWAD